MVSEYTTKFMRLSHFENYLIDTPEAKTQQDDQGLGQSLQSLSFSHLNKPFIVLIGLATSQEGITKREQRQFRV